MKTLIWLLVPGFAWAQAPTYTQVISNKLAPLMQKCVKHIEKQIPNLREVDTFTLNITPNGKAKNFSYVAKNKISRAWLDCAKCQIEMATYPQPPRHRTYTHIGTMTWGLTTDEVQPERLEKKREKIRQFLSTKANVFQECYAEYLSRGGKKEGSVVVVFSLDPVGSVTTSRLNIDELKDISLESCLTGALRQLDFPAAEDGEGTADVSQPLLFAKEAGKK
jgi:hypothetical protein